ncbi:MAG: hypothetical protein COA47_02500 [Robiginitomaculum sp.]|nr:MAG: hypothetical protein COA47_02500 [Robiginitomaculum sp.]
MSNSILGRTGISQQVLIIGGGLIGVTTLFELSRRGVPALLLEAGSELAGETSFANGGMLAPSHSEPWNGPGILGHLVASLFDPDAAVKLRLGAIPGLLGWGLQFVRNAAPQKFQRAAQANYLLSTYSAARTRQITLDHGLQYHQSDKGTLRIFSDQKAMDWPLQMARTLALMGLDFEVVSPAQAIQIEPQLAHSNISIAGGLYAKNDGVGDAHLFTWQLARLAQKSGGEIRLNTKVNRLVQEGGQVIGVETDGAMIRGPVVLAAGIASVKLAARIGLQLPIQPAKGYSISVEAGALGEDQPKIPILDDAMHVAVSPIGKILRVVGTAEFAGNDLSLRSRRLVNLRKVFTRMYPQLNEQLDWGTAQSWAGLRPMSADGVAFIGAALQPGLWLNCGHGHLGWTMAAGSAQLLVDQMLGTSPAIEPAPFQWIR